jgi:hypothetical protein
MFAHNRKATPVLHDDFFLINANSLVFGNPYQSSRTFENDGLVAPVERSSRYHVVKCVRCPADSDYFTGK